ncbi:alkaline phosphatase family protein (plasmid) [Streptomyces viridifaciens]|nr:alkaline phosphatase family protein [Streptomyces viridifaciens]
MTASPRLVVLCIDGGLPGTVATWNFFSPHRRLPGVPDSGARALRSIFPSSTAPAHASFLTGTHPDVHGIVGNRFWTDESVKEIRDRASNPVLTLHPYETDSLRAPSLLEWFADQGLRSAAVHFPHTFSRHRPVPAVSSLYCLYAPSRSVQGSVTGNGSAFTTPLAYFDETVELTVRMPTSHYERALSASLGHGGTEIAIPLDGSAVRMEATIRSGHLSLSIACTSIDDGRVDLKIGTAVLTLSFGAIATRKGHGESGPGPASLTSEYTANPDHDFHEAPNAEWICRTALDVIANDEPDVLFLRFNQADHAQELLYWHAARANRKEAALARDQILGVYQTIDAYVSQIMRAVGPKADYVLFSDHGIDYVETQLHPNSVLRELDLAGKMIFQGDSNIAYLYADEPLRAPDRDRILAALSAADPTVRPASSSARVRLPLASGRTGELAIVCGPHREFDYAESGSPRLAVRSASHGHVPTDPAMNGFFRMFGPGTDGLDAPDALTGAADLIKRLWLRRWGPAR